MAPLTRFLEDTHGGMVQRVAIMCGAIALASLGGTHLLRMATREGMPRIAFIYPTKQQPAIDYAPTGSVRAQAGRTVLDPCTGKPK